MTLLAQAHLALGERAQALDLVEQMLTRPSHASPAFARFDPTWASLRDEPKFKKLVGLE